MDLALITSIDINRFGFDIWFNFKQFSLVGWLFGFYGTSNIVGYLMPNIFYTNKQFYFKQFNLA